MEKDNRFLATEPVGRLLFRLAIPTIAAQLINMLYNIVDRIYIGHLPGGGDLALTGVGVCLPIILFVSAFSALVSASGAPRASIFMGKGDTDSASRTMGGCFSLQVVVSVVLTAVILIWNEPILLAFGATPETIEYASSYMGVYAFGTIFVELTLGMNAYITAQGFAGTGMLTVLIGAIINIILDPVFIFILDLGVRGAALATVISQGISCVWVVAFLSSGKSILRLKLSNMSIIPSLVLPCLALGIAPFVMQASESIISVCFNTSLRKYGSNIAVGSMTILSSVMQFAMMPLQGLSQGAQPISSYNFGAGNVSRVKEVFRFLLLSSVIYSTALWALIMLFPQVFAGIFTPKPELISYAARAMRVYCGAMLLFGVQIACQMTFVSLGNARASAIVAIVRKFVLLIPLIYIMPAVFTQNQAMAVYAAEPVADVIAVTFTAILFARQFNSAMRELEWQVYLSSYQNKEDNSNGQLK